MSALPPSSGGPIGAPAVPREAFRVVALEPRHHDEILTLNTLDVEVLSPLDERRLAAIVARTAVALVAEDDHGVLGFCLALEPGTDYDSRHYAWFSAHRESFLYLDRVVVSTRARRRGVGTRLYEACEAHAAPLGRMLCEVDVVPLNATSMAFHASRGYVEIGRNPAGPPERPDAKVVAMLEKPFATPDGRRPARAV